MAVREIKTRLKIEGDAEYKRSIKQVNSELSTLKSEMKVVDERFAGNEKSVESLTAKSDVLSRKYDKQKEKLEILRSALKNAQTAQESANQRVEDARDKYNRAQQQLDEYKKSSDKTADGQKQLEDALENAGKELEVAERAQRQAAEAVEDYGKKSNYTQAEIYKLEKQLETTNKDLDEANSEAARAAQAVEDLGYEMQDSAEKSRDFGEKSSDGVNALASAIAASGVKEGLQEITAAIRECTDASIGFESAITGVYKTVDGTPQQLAAIRDGIKQMSTEIPATTTQIAGVAEAAGQLGIATDDVLDFTRVMIDLGESTNLSADEAASSLAKFANITGTAASDYSRLGSVIVGLGNNFATTEADIVAMATRLASAGELAGLTEPEIMALAAAMSSVGIEAEAGGTAMTQTMTEIEKAVAKGGDDLELFASVAGMSAREFANRWNSNATSAIQAFVAGLGRLDEQGESATLTLEEMGLSGVRQSNMLKSLALASDQLSGAVEFANTAWVENTALTEEAGKRYETTESKVKMAENAFDNLKVAIGDQLKPALEGAAEAGTDAFTWAADFVAEHPEVVGALTAVTTAMGLLAVGVTGYAIATTVVIPLIHNFNAALAASPVGAAAVAITALVSVLAGLAVAFANTEPPQEDYRKKLVETRQETDDLERSIENLNDTIAQNHYNADDVKIYIRQLERLEERGLENAAVQELYNETLDKIREIMPDLAIAIDETTGAVEGGTDALLLNVEALTQQKDAVEALSVLEDANNTYEKTAALIEENTTQIEKYREQWNMMAEEQASVEPYSERWWELNNAMSVIVTDTIPTLQAQDEVLREELALQEEQVAAAQSAYDQYNQTVSDGNDTLAAANDAYTTFSTTMDGIQADLQQLQTEYEEAYNAAYTNITGQFGLFNQMESVVGTSVDDMIGSLQSQAEYMDEYALNMQKAAQLGVDEGLLSELSDGSTESARILKGIVEDGGENVQKLNIQFRRVEEGKKTFSDKMAKMSTDFDKRMSDIDKRLKKSVDEFNQSKAAADATEETIQGIVNTANARVGAVRSAYANLARQANYAYRSTLDIHSPSKVFERNTDMTIEGITGEVEKKKPDVAKSYQNLAGVASGSYYDATQKTQMLYAQTIRSYNKLTAVGSGAVSGAQLARIVDKLDDIKRATEENRMDEDALADKLGDAVSRVQVKAEAVISARRAAEEMTPEVDKRQGNTLALRKRGVI